VIVVGSGLGELTDILQTPEALGLQHILISSSYPHVGFLWPFFLLVEPIFYFKNQVHRQEIFSNQHEARVSHCGSNSLINLAIPPKNLLFYRQRRRFKELPRHSVILSCLQRCVSSSIHIDRDSNGKLHPIFRCSHVNNGLSSNTLVNKLIKYAVNRAIATRCESMLIYATCFLWHPSSVCAVSSVLLVRNNLPHLLLFWPKTHLLQFYYASGSFY